MRRPSGPVVLLAVLMSWPVLHVIAYVLGTTVEQLLIPVVYSLGYAFGAIVVLGVAAQIIRR